MLKDDYIIGLVDGEGSFTCFIRKPEKKHWNYRIECHFYIKLREDDLKILKRIKKFFNCGRISLQKDKRPNHRNNYRFEVSNLNDLKRIIIPFFKKNPLQTKRIRDFILFTEIVKMISEKKHQTQKGLNKIKRLKTQMHQ